MLALRKAAYAVGLRPWEIDVLTPGEIVAMTERSKESWLQVATLATWVRSTIWGKHPVRPETLLGWATEEKARPLAPKEVARVFAERARARMKL